MHGLQLPFKYTNPYYTQRVYKVKMTNGFRLERRVIDGMNMQTILIAVLSLLSGIGVFLVACSMMSSNLEAAGSSKLNSLFAKTSDNKLLGVGIGAAATAAIQSSGAITVMVIGFVNVGILTLKQAASIIFGANIGTTITGQIVALGMSGSGGISTTILFSAFAGVGAFLIAFAKNPKFKTLGGILAGFGMLFIGLNIMSSSMETFAQDQMVIQFLARIQNVFLLVLLGALLTAIVQSSSVVTSVVITMVVARLITIDQGIYLTMGSNIGSCIVALIAGLSGGVNAKRTSIIHLLFNTIGVAVFLTIILVMNAVLPGEYSIGNLFRQLFPSAPQLQLAMFHTIFNVLTTVFMLPFIDQLVAFVERLIPEQSSSNEAVTKMFYLDENMLGTPVVAIGQLKREIIHMSEIAITNYYRSLNMITALDFSDLEKFQAEEEELNYLNKELVNYVVKLSDNTLGKRDREYLNTTLRSIADLERIGDYAENITEYAQSLKASDEKLTTKAVNDVSYLKQLIESLYHKAMDAYSKVSLKALDDAQEIEEEVDEFTDKMEEGHIKRLTEGVCSARTSEQFLELCSNSERIADHLINVAETIKKLKIKD